MSTIQSMLSLFVYLSICLQSYVYMMDLPFALANSLHYATIVVASLIGSHELVHIYKDILHGNTLTILCGV